MKGTLIRNARLHSDTPGEPLADIVLRGGVIAEVRRVVAGAAPAAPTGDATDAAGRVVLPGFVDCHTHACWFDPDGIHGSHRLDEWELRRRGTPYLDILRAGGGIMATVRAVRGATRRQLADQLGERLAVLRGNGTTTVEVKSGYGLSTDGEIKMLRAIHDQPGVGASEIVATALLGHAIDPDVPRDVFVRRTIAETLDAVHAEFPGITIDAYCEEGAWSPEECEALFRRANSLGHPLRVHVDQFHSLGFTPRAVALGARSVDHLEASTRADLESIARAAPRADGQGPFAVALPACGYHLDGRYANLAALAAACPERVCIATNLNPGSAPCYSMAPVIALAVQHCGLSVAQAIAAATANPARLLGLSDRGEIAPGKRADLVLLNCTDARSLAFTSGINRAATVWQRGHLAKGP